MNGNSEDYKEPIVFTSDQRGTEGADRAASGKDRRASIEGTFDCIDLCIERGIVSVSKVDRLVVKVAVLLIGIFVISRILILDGKETVEHLNSVPEQSSSVHSKPIDHTVGDPTQEPSEVATNPTANEVATNPTANEVATNAATNEVVTNLAANEVSIDVKPNSDSTPLTRPKGKDCTSSGSRDYSQTSPRVAARSRKLIIEDFTLPLNKVVTFREVNGVVRSRELPSPIAPTSWGNSIAPQ